MPEKRFELGDYVEVKDRIAILYERFPQARIETTYELTAQPDERPKVICRAFVYRKPEDDRPAGHGTSWLYLPGATPYTKGSEIENAETSAVGRAIGMLGILIDRSIATSNEIENKAGEDNAAETGKDTTADPYRETEELLGDYAGTGMVRLGSDDYKLESRDGPNGHSIGFRLEFKDDKAIPQVIVEGPAGEALYLACGMNAGSLRDTKIHVKGRLFTVKPNRPRRQSWKRLRVSEWSNADYTFPSEAPTAPLFDDADLPAPPDDVELPGERVVA